MRAIRQHILVNNKGGTEVRPKSAGIGTLNTVGLLETAHQEREAIANTPKGAHPVDALTVVRRLRSDFSHKPFNTLSSITVPSKVGVLPSIFQPQEKSVNLIEMWYTLQWKNAFSPALGLHKK